MSGRNLFTNENVIAMNKINSRQFTEVRPILVTQFSKEKEN